MEPLRLSDSARERGALGDLAVELTELSAAFRSGLPEGLRGALASFVRLMNCYYSNIIEEHHTHPIDIERALANDYATDPHKRDLQLEAQAHVAVQKWLDEGHLAEPATAATLCMIHRRFCELLPDSLLWVHDPKTGQRHRVEPGLLRTRDVRVGQHIAISAGAVPRFLERFAVAYSGIGRLESIIAAAVAHHRLLWIHPFLDGNGRVARLMSNEMLRVALNTGSLWSVARGLARSQTRYKQLLANCDLPRRNALDGRGVLSEEALLEFTRFFLETCIDQVKFMHRLMQPDTLIGRIKRWALEEIACGALPLRADNVLEAILYRGSLMRGEVAALLGVTDRHARRVTSALIGGGVVTSVDHRAALTLAFPAALASHWMPGLFPEKVD
ncbi:MAG: Fic family protein [Clostridia bacterium]|nr:Fic family protein [Deltaproteobacteria bacterium]